MNPIERLHERYVKQRRVRALARAIGELLPSDASVLDVGCGDGLLAEAVLQQRRDVSITGIDVLLRHDSRIPVREYDGIHIPFPAHSVDVVMFVDVLHHTTHADELVQQARRIARRGVLIKDHCADGFLATQTLRFMDKIGNARFGVALPHIYLRWKEWQSLFRRQSLSVALLQPHLRLYPAPLSWLFDRSLHFLAFLRPEER